MTDQPAFPAAVAGAEGAARAAAGLPPAQFALVYESRDGRLCIFEDAAGHLTAVRAEKLA